jgi:hypothetical protein
VWVNFGQPVYPPTGLPRRQARVVMGEQLKRAYMELYRELRSEFGLSDEVRTMNDERKTQFIVHRS